MTVVAIIGAFVAGVTAAVALLGLGMSAHDCRLGFACSRCRDTGTTPGNALAPTPVFCDCHVGRVLERRSTEPSHLALVPTSPCELTIVTGIEGGAR